MAEEKQKKAKKVGPRSFKSILKSLKSKEKELESISAEEAKECFDLISPLYKKIINKIVDKKEDLKNNCENSYQTQISKLEADKEEELKRLNNIEELSKLIQSLRLIGLEGLNVPLNLKTLNPFFNSYVRVLSPVEAYPFLARIGYAPIG